MTTLHLGVNDVPYATKGGSTTGDVAEILEAKYHVMQAFYDRHGQEVADALANSLVGQLENLRMGAPAVANPFAGGEGVIREAFRKFLESGEIETMGIEGVPTKAAKGGRSLRFKRKKNPRGRRPSFIDTGLYETSFTDWVD